VNVPFTFVAPFTVKLKLLPEVPTARFPPIDVVPLKVIVLDVKEEFSVTFPENAVVPMVVVPEVPLVKESELKDPLGTASG
jgi:hypothetical protein